MQETWCHFYPKILQLLPSATDHDYGGKNINDLVYLGYGVVAVNAEGLSLFRPESKFMARLHKMFACVKI